MELMVNINFNPLSSLTTNYSILMFGDDITFGIVLHTTDEDFCHIFSYLSVINLYPTRHFYIDGGRGPKLVKSFPMCLRERYERER